MRPNEFDLQCSVLCPNLLGQLDPRNHLLGLAKVIPWQVLKGNFRPLCAISARSGKPVRSMVGLLALEQFENLSDERVVEAWAQNPYFVTFCGQRRFVWKQPCDSLELAYFRRLVGKDGVRKIFEISKDLHGDKTKEAEVVVDSSMQDKNLTFTTDVKIQTKIVMRFPAMAKLGDVKLQRNVQREVKSLFRTVTCILSRDLNRKFSPETQSIHQRALDLCDPVQLQQRSGASNIYRLHEPRVSCISKGKAQQKYEFGARAPMTKTCGIIVGHCPSRSSPSRGTAACSVSSRKHRGAKAGHDDLRPWLQWQAQDRREQYRNPRVGQADEGRI